MQLISKLFDLASSFFRKKAAVNDSIPVSSDIGIYEPLSLPLFCSTIEIPLVINKQDTITPPFCTVTFTLQEKETFLFDKLTRYYELNHIQIIERGLWLMTLMRDAEINGGHLALLKVNEEDVDKVEGYLIIKPY